MVSWQARFFAGAVGRRRRLVPVGVIVLVYLVAGTLWIFGSSPVADVFAEATSIPPWVVEPAKGVLFVVITALVLRVVLRRRSDWLDASEARTDTKTRELAASEDRNLLQATALSATANAVIITDVDGTIEWVNAAFEAMSGYPASVAIGATPRLVHSGVQDAAFYREMWATILAGKVWRGQLVNRRSDGEFYTVSQTITPVVAERDEIQNFVAICEDITDRITVARALDAGRVRLQSLFDHALDAIVLADDDGRYIDGNPAICQLTGYARDELLGMRVADLAAPDQQPTEVANQFDEFVHSGTEAGTFLLRHKDGHIIETEYRAVANTQPGVHLSVLRDVTTRNAMLRALTVAETEFLELAENAADIVAKLEIDQEGRKRVDYVNPAASTVLGYSRDRLYANPDLLFALLQQHRHALDDGVALAPTPDEPFGLATVQVQRADGQLLWLEIHSTVSDATTAPVAMQLVGRDVTARFAMTQAVEQALRDQLEAAEQLRTLNAMKDTFLQSVSHELRTPLTAILGFAQLLANPRHGLSPGDTREFHQRILNNAERLQQLLDDLLDLDRFSRDEAEPHRLPTDVAALIERVVDDIDLGEHAVELDLEPVTTDLDAPLIERAIGNLLHNITRHTPPDTRVWIQARATPEGVEITVDDDGPGIPEADWQRVIEPFEQGTVAASAAQPGTGIGLALVDTFARIHGGKLTLGESAAGGTRVNVTLARESLDKQEESAASASDAHL